MKSIIEKKKISSTNSSDLINISVCFCGGTPNLVRIPTERSLPPSQEKCVIGLSYLQSENNMLVSWGGGGGDSMKTDASDGGQKFGPVPCP